MTFIGFVFIALGLAVAFLVGVGFACYRLKVSLRTRGRKPASTLQAVVKTFGGGAGGPVEPF